MSRRVEMNAGPIVLVVDPDPTFRAALCAALVARRVRALPAESAREALATLDRSPAGVLVVSAELPDMGGFDLVRTVRRQSGLGHAAVFIVTEVSWGPSQKAAAIQQMGLSDILVRPIAPEAVAATVVQNAIALSTSPSVADAVAEPAAALGELSESELADPTTRRERREVEKAARSAVAAGLEGDLRGNLSATPFPRLLHSLYRRRATGALFLLRDAVKKIVYFREGHPSYIKSNVLGECLGKVLVREGMITEAQCKESLRRMKQSHRQQGTVLIEMGIISPQNLVVGLELQLRTKLLDIFSWTRGEYLFQSQAKVPADVIQLEIPCATLILDGLRVCWDAARLEEALAPYWDQHLAPNESPELRFQELSLLDEEQMILDGIDGLRTLRQIAAESPLPRTRTLAVLYALIATSVMEPRAEPEEIKPAPEREPPAEEEPLRAQLAAQLVSLRQRDAYGILGVQVSASDAAIEQAYSVLAREYHPDRFRNAPPETRQLSDEIFGLIFEAYREIASAELRGHYRARLNTAELAEVSSTLAGERLRAQAEELCRAGRFAEAVRRLEGALAHSPEAAELRALHGWALFHAAPEDADTASRALRELRRAIELDPRSFVAHLSLGRIYAQMGKAILAEKQLEKAVQCRPDSEEALRELLAQRKRRPPRRGRG